MSFPHLTFRSKITGEFKAYGGGSTNPKTLLNSQDRTTHAHDIDVKVQQITTDWNSNVGNRVVNGLSDLPDSHKIPVFLQVDTQKLKIESLKGFGIEVISEENDGYIIGVSLDNFISLKDKMSKFLNGTYGGEIFAGLWDISTSNQWRLENILSEDLLNKWDEIIPERIYMLDIGIACYLEEPNYSDIDYDRKLHEWQLEWDRIATGRQNKFEEFIRQYEGRLISGYIDLHDSFSCRIEINGTGLKDIALNYQYVFDISEAEELTTPKGVNGEERGNLPDIEILPPDPNSETVCIIDSGIQEGHMWLAKAIKSEDSHCFIPNTSTNNVADEVVNGGHGTRVASAVLYPKGFPADNPYRLPFYIQNAKVLNRDNSLSRELYPPRLMQDIVSRYLPTKFYNLSITSYKSSRRNHMSIWAATIDKLTWKEDILFIIATGNISSAIGGYNNPSIREHLARGRDYPNYLLEASSHICNPAQSCFSLTVGSVCVEEFEDEDRKSFGSKDDPSSFTRTGPGIWDMIKPDVVEYGGDFIRSKDDPVRISLKEETCPELFKSTLSNGEFIGRDLVGTSFAAPKVTYIIASIANAFPAENTLFYKALVAHSARLPKDKFRNPSKDDIRYYGYGIPDLHRALSNFSNRITYTASGDISPKQAGVYSIKIPQELSNPGDDYDFLIEITLSYKAEPRRTRKGTKGYLSGWLEWKTSKFDDTYEKFKNRVIKLINNEEVREEQEGEIGNTIPWNIRERKDYGIIQDFKRQDSTLQKDWCIIKSHQLPKELCIAVIGHSGWSKDLRLKIPFSLVVSIECLNQNIEVYEKIKLENEIEIET